MKKRVLSLLMCLVLLISLLPTATWAANETPTSISTAEQFAAMSYDGNYKLTEDITVTTPYSSQFRGTFDGDGHTVTLNLNVNYGNAGLFGETGNGAVIENTVVVANVTSSAASSSYGTGGLIGKVSGSTTVENCGVSGEVKNTATSSSYGIYVGGLIGYVTNNLTIKNCFSTANVTATGGSDSSAVGGLIAKTSIYYTLSVSDCYTTGDVTANKGSAGGITGYVYCSGSYKHTYENCYAAGVVTSGTANKAFGFAYSYATTGYTFTNCYSNSVNTSGVCNKTDTGIIAKSADELKELAETLGDGFLADGQSVNGGYPILSWQYFDPDAEYTVSFSVTPTDSVLTWNGTAQTVASDGKYTFADVAVGAYNYSVANEAGDYATQSGTVTVKNKNVSTDIALALNTHTLTFVGLPENAELTVKDGEGAPLTPNSDGNYTVTKGEYTYSASAFGYQSVEGQAVTVGAADKTETVALVAQPVVTVTFAYADGKADVSNSILTVKTGERVMTAKDGSDGLVYELPVGYSYDWTFRSTNYGKQSNTVDLTSTEEAGTLSVTIPMTAKIAWEGGDDITEPAKDTEGVYQITSGSELAWLAQEVNAGRGTSYNAVLCKDIDLGNENWTPIGKNSGYAYKGVFDGQGFEIKNLKITGSTSANYGLFGYVYDGTVKNLAVSGNIQITGSGSDSYGIGGIVGQLYGTAKAENCVNKVTVSANYNTGGIVGYANASNYEKTVVGCVNLGEISGSNSVGGIVGQFYGKGNVENCYNRGEISASVSKAGGIVGYLYSSSNSYKNAVSNCYSTGTVSANQNKAAIVGSVYSTYYSTITDCYYLDSLATDSNATAKSEAELKALAETLGEAFIAAPTGLNDGYPILRWQVPTYAVTFTVSPEHAKVTIAGQTGTQNGVNWSFKLPDGTYNYTVSAFGYGDKNGSITVSGGAVSENVTLTAAEKRTVTFAVSPTEADAKITVTWRGETVSPEADGSYRLPDGTYQYSVKAKGYAREAGELTVSADGSKTVSVSLTASTAWDESTTEKPTGEGTQTSPYEIDNGEALAWLAKTVNEAASVQKLYVKLTDDIDLGEYAFTPIGKDTSHPFTGEFDGQGYSISGLKVSGVEYAGLFGVVKDATIKNVVVKGGVTGTGETGGLVGFAQSGTVTIENCGNEAVVSAPDYAGGILGKAQAETTIKNSYNTGNVSTTGSNSYAGGIAAYPNGNGTVSLTDCYNTGRVSGTAYAGGLRARDGSYYGTITNCYSTGNVTGADSKTGALVPGSYTSITNSYYENGTDSHEGAVNFESMTTDLLSALGKTNWKTVRGINGGLPVLNWQKDVATADAVTLAKNVQFEREDVVSLEGDETSLPVGKLKWNAVNGATSYTVSLWLAVPTWTPLSAEELAAYKAAKTALEKLDIADETGIIAAMTDDQRVALELRDEAVADAQNALQNNTSSDRTLIQKLLAAEEEAQENRAEYIVSVASEDDLGNYIVEMAWVKDIPGVTGTTKDLTAEFAALDEGMYYASVAAETDGQIVCVSLEDVKKNVVGYQDPYNRMQAVANVRWDGTIARWGAKAGFTRNQTYQIDLYTVTGSGEDLKYTYYKSFTMPGQYTAANLANEFAAEKKYAFRVTALSDSELQGRLGLSDSLVSAYSDIYDPGAVTEPAQKEWVEISSAEEWIALANVEDVPTDGNGSDSRQLVAWTKNYRLTKDIDFSQLSAADQTKTKSIGTVTYPFMGEFDGQGHKITGLTLSNNDSGLFWYVGATGYVHDLTVDSANVLFSDNAAVLVHNNKGRVENCAVLNTNITADTGAVLGGMVSRNYGIIRNSYVQGGSLTSNTTTAVGHAGFVGANEEGGLIENCWTSMDISTKSAHAGGFVGLGYGGTIRNCFALGDVSADRYSGGFVGRSVYDGNIYENCYAAGVVTVTSEEGNGFIGGNQAWSGFQYDQSEGITNCYYNSATQSAHDYGAVGKSLEEMKKGEFLALLSGSESGVWAQDADKNDGLPYLVEVKAPESTPTTKITVSLAVATYDKTSYSFVQAGETLDITLDSNGNTRLVDLMDAAQAQEKLTYSYATTSTFGRYIHTINDYAVESPDGWMFTINDQLSNVSASLATVTDGDKVLWFEGTTENRFQGPTWAELSGAVVTWVEIASVEDLLALANATAPEALAKNYRLTCDLDLSGVTFSGIGTADAPFTGVFDGQNHTISNMTITASDRDNVGFFGVIKGATIKNLKLTGVSVTGKKNVGTLVGYAQAELDTADMADSVASLIGSCTVTGEVSGTESVGGLVGLNEGKTDKDTLFSIACAIDKCTADVAVTGSVKTGGLVGDNGGTVTGSAAKGTVTAADGSMTGGLAGSSTGDIYDSYATGAVAGKTHTGGFVGSASGKIKSCYSLGNVTGTDYTGSFAGSITQADTVVGAGQVSVIGTPASGYNGGFAGYLGGTLAGLSNQITVKNTFGNCTQAEGDNLKVVGNASAFSTDSQKTALESMTLSDWQAVSDKLYELFRVVMPGAPDPKSRGEVVDALLQTISAANVDNTGVWWVMDMGAYANLGLSDSTTSGAAKQTYINNAIHAISAGNAGDTDYSKAILALTAIGVDVQKLYPVNSNTPVNAITGLNGVTQSASAWRAPYTLAAYCQGDYESTETYERGLVDALLASQKEDGSWDEWGTIDTTANVIAGLSFYANEALVKAAVDKGIAYLASQLKDDGTYENANSTAMVIIGLAAAGVNPGTDSRFIKNGVSVLDGLLSFALADNSGFWYTDRSTYNDYATEQAFRALIAAKQVMKTGLAYNVYDFSSNTVAPGRASGSGSTSTPPASTGDTITVKVSVCADTGYWMNKKRVTIPGEGATVYHAFIKALEGSGIEQVGAESNYVSSMTKDGVTLGEFTNGDNSGWLYKVNDTLPNVGLTEYSVKNGDSIVFYYTNDWTLDPDAGSMGGTISAADRQAAEKVIDLIGAIGDVTWESGAAIEAARAAYDALSTAQKALVTNYGTLTAAEAAYAKFSGFAFTDVAETAWYYEAIRNVYEQGFMTGVSATLFLPEGTATRAQVVTILHRLAGSPAVDYQMAYSDVAEDAWFAEAIRWATSEGVVTGYSDRYFGPDDEVTREQLAAMFYRYAQKMGIDFTGQESDIQRYDDVTEIGVWAKEAMEWCVRNGILKGTSDTTLSPAATATRAQLATMLGRFCTLLGIEGAVE